MKTIKLKLTFLFLLAILAFCIIPSVSALSNESTQAKQALEQAQLDISEMQNKEIPISRVNETYSEALQIYTAQIALEEKSKNADYKVVFSSAREIAQIKDVAIKASDELHVFDEEFKTVEQETNLSEIQPLYDDIHRSFREERFEETLSLINQGYEKMSEIQASQTAARAFANAVGSTLKNFFTQHWKKLSSLTFYQSLYFWIIIAIVVIILFWKTILKIKVKLKISNLNLQKKTLNNLIKKLQYDYFKLGKISETEYKVKSEKFKEMTRDIDRQIPLLKEEMLKIDKSKIKSFEYGKDSEADSSSNKRRKRK